MSVALKLLAIFAVFGIVEFVLNELSRPDVLLVGNITVDVVEGATPVGGAVSYAAAALRAFGISACVVTVVGPEANLSIFDGHELHVINASSTLTFEHTYALGISGYQRHLKVTANPNIMLTRSHVPKHCQRARIVILGPLTLNDVDAGSFLEYDGFMDRVSRWGQLIGNMAQGYQRDLSEGDTGEVLPLPTPSPQLLAGLGRGVSLFLSDVETHSWSEADIAAVAGSVSRMLVTQGKKGALEYNSTGMHVTDAYQVDAVVDTNGAGDTFATAYMLALARGHPDPAWWANWAAGQAVRRPQSCKPGCIGDYIQGQVEPWTWGDRFKAAARDAATGAIEVVNQAEMFLRALASGEITVPEVIAQVQAALFPQRASPHQAGAEAEAEGAAGTAASS